MSLLENIKDLIPSKVVDVYGTSVHIRPLTIERIGLLIPKFETHWSNLNELGVDLDSLTSKNNKPVVFKLVSYFVKNGVDVLEDVTGLDKEVFKNLPIDKSVEIITAAIEVNAKSADNLLKNWTSLVEILSPFLPSPTVPD